MVSSQSNTFALGRRKRAIAQVRVIAGKGKIEINGRSIKDYFKNETLMTAVEFPLKLAGKNNLYDLAVWVNGGGLSGQAGAIRLGIARALVKLDEAMRKPFRKAGLLTRDSREVERKKYGRPGARRRFQFSKR